MRITTQATHLQNFAIPLCTQQHFKQVQTQAHLYRNADGAAFISGVWFSFYESFWFLFFKMLNSHLQIHFPVPCQFPLVR
jgi:sarcosine oxidase gamma subunit